MAHNSARAGVPRVNPMETEGELMRGLDSPVGEPETTASVPARTRAKQLMIAFHSLALEMCACSSPVCATAVQIRVEALDEAYGDLEPGAFSDRQQEDLMLAALQMAECQDQIDRRVLLGE